MRLMTAHTSIFRGKRSYGLVAAVVVWAVPGSLYSQSTRPSACNVDSDGFCLAGPVKGDSSLSSAPQVTSQVASTPAPEKKLVVEFRNDLLRIDAENATLRETLKAVSARTGAEVQFPAGGLEERIFAHLGPASPREIVSQLLKGVAFNYVILSSASEPRGITRLILTRAADNHEAVTPEVAALPGSQEGGTQVYGASFAVNPDTSAAELVPSPPQESTDGASSKPVATWIHNDGPKLSGEQLDQMQKMQIQQEQQQFAEQTQQQHQQPPQ